MISHDYVCIQYDNYSKKLLDNSLIYLLLYFDDMLIVASSKAEIDNLKTILSSEFEMKDLGAAKKTLGINDRELFFILMALENSS